MLTVTQHGKKTAVQRGVIPELAFYCWISSGVMPADLVLVRVQQPMASGMAISDKPAALKSLLPSNPFLAESKSSAGCNEMCRLHSNCCT